MLDGQNIFEHSNASFGVGWMCHETANHCILSGKTREFIIVGIHSPFSREEYFTPSYDPIMKVGGKADEYLIFIERVVSNVIQ